MISVILFLGALFSVGQCGGPAPTPPPTKPPTYGGVSCSKLTMGSCDAKLREKDLWEVYRLPGVASNYATHTTEEQCQEGCEVLARKWGPGCCSFGPYQTDTQPSSCHYVKGRGAYKQSTSYMNHWQQIHKISICTTSAEEAVGHSDDEEAELGHNILSAVWDQADSKPIENLLAAGMTEEEVEQKLTAMLHANEDYIAAVMAETGEEWQTVVQRLAREKLQEKLEAMERSAWEADTAAVFTVQQKSAFDWNEVAVYGFAVLGFGALVYGAGSHFLGKKAGSEYSTV